MNIPVLSKNAEGLEGLASEEAAPKKKPSRLEFSRRPFQHNWMNSFILRSSTDKSKPAHGCFGWLTQMRGTAGLI